ncbi:MAG TPA: hypothetical protein VJ854_03040 [Sphaerochaeta sp.]|nr:hypothetical protein [Sphaerochaeta sp.]
MSVRYGGRGYILKIKGLFSHAVTQDVVMLLNTHRSKVPTRVGESWQPDVAQFLLDMFPDALEYGMELSDLAEMVSEDEFDFDFEPFEFSSSDDEEYYDDEDDDV